MKTSTNKNIDLDDIQGTIKTITNYIDMFTSPEDYMEVEDQELKEKLMPDWKLKVACDLQFQLTVLKFFIGQRFEELPAFDRTLNEVTRYIDKMTKKETKEVK